MVQFVFSVIETRLELIKSVCSFDSFAFEFILCFIKDFLLLGNKVSLRFDLVIKSDLLTFQLGDLFGNKLVFLDEFAAFKVEGLLALIDFELTRLHELIKSLSLFTQLLVINLKLLGKKSDLTILLSAGLVELVAKLGDLVIQLILDIFRLLLLEENLVLIINFSLSKPLISLITNIIKSLLESHFFGIIELL